MMCPSDSLLITGSGAQASKAETCPPCESWRMHFSAMSRAAPSCLRRGIAHRIDGMTCWFAGDFLNARRHLELALVSYDGERDRPLAYRFGQDLAVPAMAYLAMTLWPLGIGDGAQRLAEETITHALRTGHIPTIAYAYLHGSFFEMVRHDHLRCGHTRPDLPRSSTRARDAFVACERRFSRRLGALARG